MLMCSLIQHLQKFTMKSVKLGSSTTAVRSLCDCEKYKSLLSLHACDWTVSWQHRWA